MLIFERPLLATSCRFFGPSNVNFLSGSSFPLENLLNCLSYFRNVSNVESIVYSLKRYSINQFDPMYASVTMSICGARNSRFDPRLM